MRIQIKISKSEENPELKAHFVPGWCRYTKHWNAISIFVTLSTSNITTLNIINFV